MRAATALPKLTDLAHFFLRESLRAGDLAIDATCGNGHDTVALAEMVGPSGSVLALDIQASAIESTQRRCQSSGVAGRVLTLQANHREISRHWQENYPDICRPKAIIFNLGYLPSGDKTIITRKEDTLDALEQSRLLISPGGLIACVCYPGHPGGDAEATAVRRWFADLPGDSWSTLACELLNPTILTPFLLAAGSR